MRRVVMTFILISLPIVLAGETGVPLNPDGISERPRWSPDGSQITYMSNRDGNFEIYVVSADGSGTTRLTRNVHNDLYPSWSSDGTQIVFSSNATGEGVAMPSPTAIFVMDPDGENVRRLTNRLVGGDRPVAYFNDSYPVWEPGGDRVAFLSDRADGFREIFIIRSDGTELMQLTFHRTHHWNLTWTPNGERIIFDGRMDGFPGAADNAAWGMHSVNVGGSKYSWGDRLDVVRNVTVSSQEYDSVVSPDGATIAFLHGHADPSRRTGRRGLTFAELTYVDGAPRIVEETMEQRSSESEYWADWSRDGKRIAVTSTRDGHAEIYVMDADGTHVRRLSFSR